MLKLIKEFLFGKRAPPICERPKAGWKTTYYGGYSTYGEWCKEFRVSMLHNRQPLHLN